ncbi:MAG: hypothetical protein KC553_10310 [Nitrospina sp.]|nr:hypothetical protein [Nitrospina sp.]
MSQETRFATFDEVVAGRIRGNQLMLSGAGLSPEEARLLWNSPRLLEISWLDLEDNRLGDEGVIELASCANAANVQMLSLSRNQITDEGLKRLAESPHLSKLKRLHLKDNAIEGEGILALFQSPTLDNLSIFHINDGWSCRKRDGWRYRPRDPK